MNEIICNEEIYKKVILNLVPRTKKFLYIGTADIKDMHVQARGVFYPFLGVLNDLVRDDVKVKLIHAKEPGPRFREDFDSFPSLISSPNFERILCPRVHFKMVIIDGEIAYTGSANLTGAGMGAKSPRRRNFEVGFITQEPHHISALMQLYEDVASGSYCMSCERRLVCPDPIR